MVAREVVFDRQHQAITGVRDVIERYDPDVAARLSGLSSAGAVPNTAKSPDLFATYLAEAVVCLAKQVDELTEANRPRPRGRPPRAS